MRNTAYIFHIRTATSVQQILELIERATQDDDIIGRQLIEIREIAYSRLTLKDTDN